jgi:hypothetical protein
MKNNSENEQWPIYYFYNEYTSYYFPYSFIKVLRTPFHPKIKKKNVSKDAEFPALGPQAF